MSPFVGTRFIASAHDERDLPPDIGAEVAFAGRSNAGKSSAINAITARKRLAYVSKTPGRTQTINFFESGKHQRLVDLPGYGYAAVAQHERMHWRELVSAYLLTRKSLSGLVLIVDSRRSITTLDEQLLGWYAPSNKPILVLLTKADKLARAEAERVLSRAGKLLQSRYPSATPQLFSAVDGTGVRTAQNALNAWLK